MSSRRTSSLRRACARATGTALALAMLATCSGCFSRHRAGWWSDDAFYTSRQHYRVRYSDPAGADRLVLAPGWRLDNFRLDGRGRPLEALASGETVLHVDRDSDGRIDLRTRQPRYELHFQHLEHDAVIWSHTGPLERIDAERSLESMLRIVVDAFAEESARVGKGELADATRRRGVRIVEEGAASFQSSAGEPVQARGVVFEVVDLDMAGPDAVLGLVELLIARPRDTWSPGGGPGSPQDPPMVVFFGFAARADEFPTLRRDFHDLLGRVDFKH